MLSRGLFSLLTLLPLAHGQQDPIKKHSCGGVNVLFTGLPPYHPLVKSQGLDPKQVDAALRADAANILKAGYNLRVVLMGPEQNISTLDPYLDVVVTPDATIRPWLGVGVGFGVRGSDAEELTVWLEEVVALFRRRAPDGTVMFDRSPGTAMEAVGRNLPMEEDCAGVGKEGGDLGFEIVCDADVCCQDNCQYGYPPPPHTRH